MTIGVEFGSYGLKIDDKVLKLQIWDTVSITPGSIGLYILIGWTRVL